LSSLRSIKYEHSVGKVVVVRSKPETKSASGRKRIHCWTRNREAR